jgi:hypothetical protein
MDSIVWKVAVGVAVVTSALHSCHAFAHQCGHSGHAASSSHAVARADHGHHSVSSTAQSSAATAGDSAVGGEGRVDVGDCDFAHYSICSKE